MECDVEKLVLYLDKQLDVDEKLMVLNHLDQCGNCLEIIYQLSKHRDAEFFVFKPYKPEKVPAW